MRIIRVFPRKTNATPDDELVRIGCGPVTTDVADEIHISVTFTWDLPEAERLAEAWKVVAPVKMGGPAFGLPSGIFTPGLYTKKGYTITSRGCPNHCDFCSVWRREHGMTELPIIPGNILQDDNILACSDAHIKAVFAMLRTQKAVELRGIEAKILKPWHVEEIRTLKLMQLFCAYDEPDDYEPLLYAGRLLTEAGISYKNRKARAYVLCGREDDTFEAAEKRMFQTVDAGFMPFAMLWRDENGLRDKEWMRWARGWSRPAAISCKVKQREVVCPVCHQAPCNLFCALM